MKSREITVNLNEKRHLLKSLRAKLFDLIKFISKSFCKYLRILIKVLVGYKDRELYNFKNGIAQWHES